MGHPDLIDVRETHGKTDRDVPVLIHCMYFISQIPCRLLYLQQKFIRQSKFSHKTVSFYHLIFCGMSHEGAVLEETGDGSVSPVFLRKRRHRTVPCLLLHKTCRQPLSR